MAAMGHEYKQGHKTVPQPRIRIDRIGGGRADIGGCRHADEEAGQNERRVVDGDGRDDRVGVGDKLNGGGVWRKVGERKNSANGRATGRKEKKRMEAEGSGRWVGVEVVTRIGDQYRTE